MTVAARVLDALGPALAAQAGELLPPLVEALTAELEPVDALVSDTPARPGWAGVLDLDTTTAPEWLGQLAGVEVPPGLDLEARRTYVRDTGGWRRGTPRSIRAAARATLRGGVGLVELVERDGSPYRFRVRVYAAQVLDLDATRRAVEALKPAGLVATVESATGGSYAHLTERHPGTYADLSALFPTYADVATHVPSD